MTDTTAPAARFELAQVNLARLKFPLDSPELKGFVDQLDPVNADADAAEGFVWRLQSEGGDATDIAVFGDEWLIVNMSVWRDLESLKEFMYTGRHREVLTRRREWFERVAEAMVTLWWVPAATGPRSRRPRRGCCTCAPTVPRRTPSPSARSSRRRARSRCWARCRRGWAARCEPVRGGPR